MTRSARVAIAVGPLLMLVGGALARHVEPGVSAVAVLAAAGFVGYFLGQWIPVLWG